MRALHDSGFLRKLAPLSLWTSCARDGAAVGRETASILARRPESGRPATPSFRTSLHETDVSAKRAQAEAQARVSGAYVDTCGTGDPETTARTWPQASLRLSGRIRPHDDASSPQAALPFPRLRPRLPARLLRGDALPRLVSLPARGRDRGYATRARSAEERRRSGDAKPPEASVARRLGRGAGAGGERLRPDRATGAGRLDRDTRLRLAP